MYIYTQKDITYMYDGSFEGMLCCVFESFEKKEMPLQILTDSISMFTQKEIVTDESRAQRVAAGINEKICPDALDCVKRMYLTEFSDKELWAVKFVRAGFKYREKVFAALVDDVTVPLKAVRLLDREARLFLQFIRFSEYDGNLVSVIEPINNVLPLIGGHFAQRMPSERFVIYDSTHKLALIHERGEIDIISVENFELPAAGGNERKYRDLWRTFYDTIEIKQRHNERCRMNHMPKRYWKNMTEFTKD